MFCGLCLCLLDITVSCSKTVEPIEMPFGLWTHVGLRNHVLGGGRDRPRERGSFEGGRAAFFLGPSVTSVFVHRFPCCGKAYPCDVCHDSAEKDHEMKFANRMICGFCAKEQVTVVLTGYFVTLTTGQWPLAIVNMATVRRGQGLIAALPMPDSGTGQYCQYCPLVSGHLLPVICLIIIT